MAFSVSPRWNRFLRRGFHPVTVVDVYHPGTGVVLENLPVESGSITIDRSNKARGKGSLVVPDPTLAPTLRSESPINPDIAEVIIKTGISYPSGPDELVPMGHFGLTSADSSAKGGNATRLEYVDRSAAVDRLPAIGMTDYGGELIQAVLDEVITDPAPFDSGVVEWAVQIDPEVDNFALPQGTVFDGGRWDFIQKLAESLGADVYFGRDGDAFVDPIPSLPFGSTAFDFDIHSGKNGTLLDVRRTINSEATFNGVLVVGSASSGDDPPFALVTDDNPGSPTFYGGVFGRRVKKVTNSSLSTVAQCEQAARKELENVLGDHRTLSIVIVGDPSIDPGDIIRLNETGEHEFYMVNSYSYDFKTGASTVQLKTPNFVAAEES